MAKKPLRLSKRELNSTANKEIKKSIKTMNKNKEGKKKQSKSTLYEYMLAPTFVP